MASRPKITWIPKALADRCTSCGARDADVHFRVAALNFALCPPCVKSMAEGTHQQVEARHNPRIPE